MPAKNNNETMASVLAKAQMELRKAKNPEDGGDMKYHPQQVFLVTTLLYGDQSIRSVMPLEYKKADMQSLGSAISYARRYSLQSICCLATDEPDDDGNKAVGEKNVEAKVNKRSNYKPKAGVASVDELKELAAGQAAERFLK